MQKVVAYIYLEVFSPSSFKIPGLTIRSLNDFDLIFVQGER
jgi:hypothetical protein